jgi:8-oxo-dGTP pyrophosphatase MutT (NUDIX family)
MSSSSSCLGVVLFVVRRAEGEHRYLLVRRSGGRFSGQWWPVAGTCHPGESPPVTALRELREETGLQPISLHRTQLEVPHSEERGFLSIFLALVEPSDRVVLNYEHDEFQWLTADGVKALIPSQTYRSVDILEGILRSPCLEGAARVWPEPASTVD